MNSRTPYIALRVTSSHPGQYAELRGGQEKPHLREDGMALRRGAGRALASRIVAAGKHLAAADLSDGISGNISARCDDGAIMLITPSGRPYAWLRPSDLVKIDLSTEVVSGLRKPSSEWRLHAAVYRTRPDVNSVVHHHGVWSSAVAAVRSTIPILIDEAADLGPIHTARYAPSGSLELATAVSETLANGSNAVLLANHGALVVASGLEEAMRRASQVERLAKILIGARLLGGACELSAAELDGARAFFRDYRAAQVSGRPTTPGRWLSTRTPAGTGES